MLHRVHRDEVFVAGGQPSITYVERDDRQIERGFARALATPNQIVSLSGPSKSGKTVLCRKTLHQREFVWIDGGQITSAKDFWERVAREIDLPVETSDAVTNQTSGTLKGEIPLIASASGSQLRQRVVTEKRVTNSMADAIAFLLSEKVVLVIDDFHYIDKEQRTELMRNIKGAVFNGLKVVLLSVTHRAFDAIKAESELTGRFMSIVLPKWEPNDLKRIAEVGFAALRVVYPQRLIDLFAEEAQESPFLMQKFCWELCYDQDIELAASILSSYHIPPEFNPSTMFVRLAEDAGLPIYRKLAAGPQSRRVRAKRPLKTGGEADIYQVTLLAIAETGPKSEVTYDELRTALTHLLASNVPQKHEITAALRHLAAISRKIGAETAVDYNEDSRAINVADPYLRFYLRWRVRQQQPSLGLASNQLHLSVPGENPAPKI